jgi:hypothetical protein
MIDARTGRHELLCWRVNPAAALACAARQRRAVIEVEDMTREIDPGQQNKTTDKHRADVRFE